jgi:hypothetical protein
LIFLAARNRVEAMDHEQPKRRRKRTGAGRPPLAAHRKRADRLTVRLTPDELAMVDRLGRDWGATPVEVLRRCLREADVARKGD